MKNARVIALALTALALAVPAAEAQRPAFGFLYYNNQVVRTVVPPAATPKMGRDPLFVFTNGAAGQLAVTAVAPGDRGYHGGQWAVYQVTFNVAPSKLTSAQMVLAAQAAGQVTIVRAPLLDFLCPIQP